VVLQAWRDKEEWGRRKVAAFGSNREGTRELSSPSGDYVKAAANFAAALQSNPTEMRFASNLQHAAIKTKVC
jgi:hypothetical protein